MPPILSVNDQSRVQSLLFTCLSKYHTSKEYAICIKALSLQCSLPGGEKMTEIGIRKNTVAAYGLMNGLFYAWNAAFYGFMSTYFLKCGMSASALSTLLAMYMAVCFAGALFWGRMCDRFHTNKKIFILCFILVMISAGISFQYASENMTIASIMYLIMGFMLASLGSNQDAWILRAFHQDGKLYGKARAAGSFGYALSMLITGFLIKRFDYPVIQIMQVLLGILCLTLAFALPEGTYETKKNHGERGSVKTLLHNPVFLFLLSFLFLEGLADSPVTNMKTVFMQDAGGDVSMLGLDSFLGVTLQAVLIFFSGRILKLKTKTRLIIVALTSMLNMVLIATAMNPYMVMAGTMLWNVSFSFRLPTEREVVEKYTDPSVRNVAHSMADAVVNNMAAIISLTYSGKLISLYGCRSIALTGIVIMIIALILVLIPKHTVRRNHVKNCAFSYPNK